GWGADVVWGTGPHVVQPVEVVHVHGRTTIIATSLGNLVFDQHIPGTRTGALLEVLAGRGGVRAYRVGSTAQEVSNAVDLRRWAAAEGDGVGVGGDWWTLAHPVHPAPDSRVPPLGAFPGEVVAAAVGDPEGNGTRQLAVSFWRPYRPTHVNALIPRSRLLNR